MQSIQTVSGLTEQLKQRLENYGTVWVQGEVAQFSASSRGHVYFDLKDEGAQLHCVWFSGSQCWRPRQQYHPLTGELLNSKNFVTVADLKQGGEFLLAGKLSIYAPRGNYQLIVEFIQRVGLGLLTQAFEQRKRKLEQMGYFLANRKRPLPINPRRVALITSKAGAAIKDFFCNARQRGLGSKIRLYDTLVQGGEAVEKIVRALELANEHRWAEVIVVIRGGGSLEDLWCFNEQPVVEAIFRSELPVLAGIGHERDYTLADMTADCRASTPTQAAILLWTAQSKLAQDIENSQQLLLRAQNKWFEGIKQKYQMLIRSMVAHSPRRTIGLHAERVHKLELFLQSEYVRHVEKKTAELLHWQTRLDGQFGLEQFKAKFDGIDWLEERVCKAFFGLCQTRLEALQTATTHLKALQILHVEKKWQRILLLEKMLVGNSPERRLSLLSEQLEKVFGFFRVHFVTFLTRKEAAFSQIFANLRSQISHEQLENKLACVQALGLRLEQQTQLLFKAKQSQFEKLNALLKTTSPERLLTRGYALVEENGN
ncbi:MAG: exodeoxyribonuclease VII large subunit, partial [Desulfovibrio sp.]|nr:exodeoxyribonuclease VII large subunit [Desulfovibrio sp.]